VKGDKPVVTAAIHQPHYLPYPGLMDKIARADVVIWLDDAQFSRGGWQNRNRVKTAHGALTLTVPIARRPTTALSATTMTDDSWRRRHRATLLQAYAHAPHLDHVQALAQALHDTPYSTLADLNLACCRHLADLMGITTPQVLASSLGPTRARRTERLVELCRRIGADTYLAGDGSAAYLDLTAFDGPVSLQWQHYRTPRYPQQHSRHGFLPDLSVIDLIANTGDQALPTLTAARGLPAGAAA
jgi:hypothetical protein